VSGQNEDSKLE